MNKVVKLMIAILSSLVTLFLMIFIYGVAVPSLISDNDTLSVIIGIVSLIMSTVIFILPIWFCIKLIKSVIKEFRSLNEKGI